MAFAGLWDSWKDKANGQYLETFTIITTIRTVSWRRSTIGCPSFCRDPHTTVGWRQSIRRDRRLISCVPTMPTR
jgi:hypothetical protein